MRIISKFKDYYDSAASLGVEMSTVFTRLSPELVGTVGYKDSVPFPEEFTILRKMSKHRIQSYSVKDCSLDFCTLYVGFCGKIYPGVRVEIRDSSKLDYPLISSKVFYSKDSLEKYIYLNKFDIRTDTHLFRFRMSLEPFKDKHTQDILKEFFHVGYEFQYPLKCALEKKWVIFMYESYYTNFSTSREVLIHNPKLSDVEFFKVFDPHTAFQEIEMFISGVLGAPNKEPLLISDKDRIQQHGFDKRSFRKDAKPGRGVFRTSQGKDDS
jgi:hypothetical protein